MIKKKVICDFVANKESAYEGEKIVGEQEANQVQAWKLLAKAFQNYSGLIYFCLLCLKDFYWPNGSKTGPVGMFDLSKSKITLWQDKIFIWTLGAA